jgi:tryptophan synthase beta subunit
MSGGSKSKSSSKTNVATTTVDQTGANIAGSAYTTGDNATITGGGHAIEAGARSTITVTDQGAVKEAFGFGSEALQYADATNDRAFGFGSEALDQVGMLAQSQAAQQTKQLDQITDFATNLRSEGQSENRKLLLWIGGGALLSVVVVAVVVASVGGKK